MADHPDEAWRSPPLQLETLSVEERAYRLHLRGMSLRAIGSKLGIDKDTAHQYIKTLEREAAPKRKETRIRLRRQAIERMRSIGVEAADRFDQTGEAQLLNTRVACEREMARLNGLYEDEADTLSGNGLTITISRRQPPTAPNASSADGGTADGD